MAGPSSINYQPSEERVVRHGTDGGKCLACGKVYSSLGYAQRHYDMVHSDSRPRIKCFKCSKTLKHDASLQHHLRVQHGIYQKAGMGQIPLIESDPTMILDVTIDEGGSDSSFGKLPKVDYTNDADDNPLE